MQADWSASKYHLPPFHILSPNSVNSQLKQMVTDPRKDQCFRGVWGEGN